MEFSFRSFNLFYDVKLETSIEEKERSARNAVRALTDEKLRNVEPEKLAQEIVEPLVFERPEIDWEKPTVVRDESVAATGYHEAMGPRLVPSVEIGFPTPSSELALKSGSRSGMVWIKKVAIENEHLVLTIRGESSAERVKAEIDRFVESAKRRHAETIAAVDRLNQDLTAKVQRQVEQRRASLLERTGLVESLGLPRLKSRGGTAAQVPLPTKPRVVNPVPLAGRAGFATSFGLSPEDYRILLESLQRFGQGLERHPSTHVGKDEEAIRDHLLVLVDVVFTLSTATAETFNHKGKTDILLHHREHVLFAAECLVWKGSDYFSAKIDQLLGYLTWREQRAALIAFVRNKEMTDVVAKAIQSARGHSNFVRETTKPSDPWPTVVFRLPQDQGIEVEVPLLLFHLNDPGT